MLAIGIVLDMLEFSLFNCLWWRIPPPFWDAKSFSQVPCYITDTGIGSQESCDGYFKLFKIDPGSVSRSKKSSSHKSSVIQALKSSCTISLSIGNLVNCKFLSQVQFLYIQVVQLEEDFIWDFMKRYYKILGVYHTGLILGLCPANERRRYKVTPSLIGWAQP